MDPPACPRNSTAYADRNRSVGFRNTGAKFRGRGADFRDCTRIGFSAGQSSFSRNAAVRAPRSRQFAAPTCSGQSCCPQGVVRIARSTGFSSPRSSRRANSRFGVSFPHSTAVRRSERVKSPVLGAGRAKPPRFVQLVVRCVRFSAIMQPGHVDLANLMGGNP